MKRSFYSANCSYKSIVASSAQKWGKFKKSKWYLLQHCNNYVLIILFLWNLENYKLILLFNENCSPSIPISQERELRNINMVPSDADLYCVSNLFYFVHFWKPRMLFLSALENVRLELREEKNGLLQMRRWVKNLNFWSLNKIISSN